jgi:predicted dithiol-disulfide oxidoreductase (DUF899 family)
LIYHFMLALEFRVGVLAGKRIQLRLRGFVPKGPSRPGATHNFTQPPHGEEHAGLSAFALHDGVVYHTYPCFARGLEAFNTAYHLLDRAPYGRGEDGLSPPHAWLRRHDQYDDAVGAASR